MVDFIMPALQLFCCNRIPNSKEADYFFDPKIMTDGKPIFEPEKIKNRISEKEFEEMRKEMVEAGGLELQKAKKFYKWLLIYVLFCFAIWITQIYFAMTSTQGFRALKTPIVISIICTAVPNMYLQCYWKYYMKKACANLTKLFEEKNQSVYASKSVQWYTRKTLMYVHIMVSDVKMVDLEADCKIEAKV